MQPSVVGSLGPRHLRVKRLRSLLSDRAARQADGVYVAEGLRVIEGLLDRDAEVRALYLEPEPHDADRAAALVERVAATGATIFGLEPGVGERITSTVTPQRVFAEVVLPETPLGAVLDSGEPLLVLVDVQDPGNAGTMLRSAEASGFTGVIFVGAGVDPWNAKVVRAGAGSHAGLSIVIGTDIVDVLDALQGAEYRSVAAVARGGVAPDALDLTGRIAFLVGSEARGLAPEIIRRCPDMVTIPMHGVVESLNAGMAATVLMFESARQRVGHTGEPGVRLEESQ